MNTITVTAHGTPHSFARRVQHDPTIAVEMVRAIRDLDTYWGLDDPIEAGADVLGIDLKDPAELNAIMAKLGELLKAADATTDDGDEPTTLDWLKAIGGQVEINSFGDEHVVFVVDEGEDDGKIRFRDFVRLHGPDGDGVWGREHPEFCNDFTGSTSQGVALVGTPWDTRGEVRSMLSVLGAKFTEAES